MKAARKIAALVAASAIALGSVVVSAPASATAPSYTAGEHEFIHVIREQDGAYWKARGTPNHTLVAGAHMVCRVAGQRGRAAAISYATNQMGLHRHGTLSVKATHTGWDSLTIIIKIKAGRSLRCQ